MWQPINVALLKLACFASLKRNPRLCQKNAAALFICSMLKKRAYIFISLFFLFFIQQQTFAQSLKKLLKKGNEAMNEKDYFSAAQLYNQVILLDSLTMEHQYLYATASRLNYDNDIALY